MFKHLYDVACLCNKGIALLDVLFEIWQASLEQFFFLSGERANRIDLLDAIFAELDVGSEEVDTLASKNVTLDKSGSDDTLLPVQAGSSAFVNLAPAYAMESVAEPAPSFALTTSSPPNWIR